VTLVGLAVLLLSGCGAAVASGPPSSASSVPAHAPIVVAQPPVPPSPVPPPITYPTAGAGAYTYATRGGPVAGSAGRLLTYRIGVEGGIAGITPDEFAGAVAATFADPRGWTGTGQSRLQRATPGAHFDFTIYLATPVTRDHLCHSDYDRYTSCRNGNSVVLNVARWVHGVPEYNGDLASYRRYLVNHETGHRLGHGHELCPGPGRPAPVMQQQTLGLHGCTPNPWPIVDGKAYAGRSGVYDDPLPRDP
jgi:hypothetical protein